MNEKLTMNINLVGKEPCHEPDKCVVEKAIPISHSEFEKINSKLLEQNYYISKCKKLMLEADGINRCILLYDRSGDGLLVSSEGCGYARYLQYIPYAKDIVEVHGHTAALSETKTEIDKCAYETKWMSTLGENINEKQVSEIVGAKKSVALSSGTAALHMAIKLTGIKHGDRVFCTDMTFGATVNPVVYEGGIPIFIDTEYDTWDMNPNALEKAFELYPDVKTVVIVNLYGVPCKLDEIKNICEKHGAVLIEDAAESLGASYKGKQTGSFGNIGCISFNGNKIITGLSGEMLLTDEVGNYEKTRKWSTQSRETAPWHQHEEIGYNYRMSNVIAGVIRGQLIHLEEHIDRKKEIYERYKNGLKGLPVKMNPYDENNSEPNFWLSCMIIDPEAMCRQIRDNCKALYISEKGKSCPTEILEKMTEYNA